MNLEPILTELRVERDLLNHAIQCFERLAMGGKRRGRPPKWLSPEARKDGQVGRTPKANSS